MLIIMMVNAQEQNIISGEYDMTCKPLKGKKKWLQKDFGMVSNPYAPGELEPSFKSVEGFEFKDIVSAVEGLIKYHEDKIDDTITFLEENEGPKKDVDEMLRWIQIKYYTIQNIEHWFSDVME